MKPDKLHLGCGTTPPADWPQVDASLQAVLARRPAVKRLLRGIGVLTEGEAAAPWSREVLRAEPLPFADSSFVAVYSSHAREHLYRDDVVRLHAHAKTAPRGMRYWYHRVSAFHQHKRMYDASSLKAPFRAAGFDDEREAGYRDSALPAIEGIEDPGCIVGGEGVDVKDARSGR